MTSATIRPEPEVLRLWKRVAEIRQDLVEKIRAWSRKDHPAMRDALKISKLYGSHGLTERRLLEMDAEARTYANELQKRLDRLDLALNVGARQDDERGISLSQLRELVGEKHSEAQRRAARAALLEWLTTDTWLTRERLHGALSQLGLSVPSDQLPDLRRRERAARGRDPSGKRTEQAARILLLLERARDGGRSDVHTPTLPRNSRRK